MKKVHKGKQKYQKILSEKFRIVMQKSGDNCDQIFFVCDTVKEKVTKDMAKKIGPYIGIGY